MHALAHAMFEDGSTEDAERLIADWLPDYDRSGILHGHISWHEALAALEHDDPERALRIYADRVQPRVSAAPPINVVTDGASLMWRLHINGHKVPPALWREAASYADQHFGRAGVPFADVHMAVFEAATGDGEKLTMRIADLEKRLAQGKLAPGTVVPTICRAMRAFADGDYAACVGALRPAADEVVRIGGSHAQRELIEDTLLVALMKCGESGEALRLLDARLHRRPSRRDARWRAVASA